jgi:3,4-dihydroxy 2-butanone 4-phosphate synthase/GTP cyclohydrolase II
MERSDDEAPPEPFARLALPTPAGEFEAVAFRAGSGHVLIALVKGDLRDGRNVLVRVHSECLTGDALGSLRCDCGLQLQTSLSRIAAEGRGVLLYVTGHEGRGIGLASKLRAYVLQDEGLDTVSANTALGLPVDGRTYGDAVRCLHALGVRSVRLLTNNPAKEAALREEGLAVAGRVPLLTSAHSRNRRYLETKRRRMGHHLPAPELGGDGVGEVVDITDLLGQVRPAADRPYVTLKYAQTLDGRIAARSGDARWISGERERRLSHGLRAACDAVMVGVGTVLADDPLLTVRMVTGISPIRVVLDSHLRTPLTAQVLGPDATTILVTTRAAAASDRRAARRRGARVVVVQQADGRVHLPSALRALREMGIRSLLVEGGASVLTALLAERLSDRMIVGIAPRVIGSGIEAIDELGSNRIGDGLTLADRRVHVAGDDLIVAGDVVWPAPEPTPVTAAGGDRIAPREPAAELAG